MPGHKYFLKGIDHDLWKAFKSACLFFDTTAKDYFIRTMISLVIKHDSTRKAAKTPKPKTKRKEKKT